MQFLIEKVLDKVWIDVGIRDPVQPFPSLFVQFVHGCVGCAMVDI